MAKQTVKTCNHVIMAVAIAAMLPHTSMGEPAGVPPGLFKDFNEAVAGDAVILNGKQLFIDDFIIEELNGAEKVLNQPVKHPMNPLLVRDRAWEESGPGYGSVIYDRQQRVYKMWYQFWRKVEGPSTGLLCYATSKDGLHWDKPIINPTDGNNIVSQPPLPGFQCAGVFRDPVEVDPGKRYKMLFSANPDGTRQGWLTTAGWSPDGIHWRASEEIPLIPFSDTQVCPYWDVRRNRYVAFLRFGPPNTRIVSRIESADFLHWSPKVTVIRRSRVDGPLRTQFYQTAVMPYEGVYVGLMAAYHNETLKPIPEDQPWTDRKNLQLIFSRDGVTWSRVGKQGAIPHFELSEDKDWKPIALDMVFLPYGRKDKDWDWGTVSPYFTAEPIIVGDEIWFYYFAQNARNWWTYAGDPPKFQPDATEPNHGVGLATLRLDGFVSVNGRDHGTLLTKTLVFLGDTIEVNANAADGSLRAEALDEDGTVIEGFSEDDFVPITTDSVRHILQWKGQTNIYRLQARRIKLRFHLSSAQLYSFTPRTHHKHYVSPSD